MKICSKCKTQKTKKEFNVDRGKEDGLQTQCRVCKRKAQKADYNKKKDVYIKRQREKRKKFPMEKKARDAVYCAIKSGKMIRPKKCSLCGTSRMRIEAHHHKGYEQEFMLDVVFLCTSCHRSEEH